MLWKCEQQERVQLNKGSVDSEGRIVGVNKTPQTDHFPKLHKFLGRVFSKYE